jgi:hypothetical protein
MGIESVATSGSGEFEMVLAVYQSLIVRIWKVPPALSLPCRERRGTVQVGRGAPVALLA